jgi:hypothetical protein
VICSSFVAAQQSADAGCKACEHRGAVCPTPVSERAGVELDPRISLRELQSHVAACHLLMQLAKARHRGTHSPQDALEAAEWSKAKDEAEAALLAARRALHDTADLTFHGEWTCEIA